MAQTNLISMLQRNKTIEITGEGYFEGLANNNYWIADSTYLNYICSACGGITVKPYKICPHCESEIKYIAEVNTNECVQNKLA